MKILSIDCALRNCGLVLSEFNSKNCSFKVLEAKLIETEKTKCKTLRQNSDDLTRARAIVTAIREWEKKADVVAAEIPVGTQSNRGAISNGITIGILASITKPLIQVQPTEVKKASVGSKTASKEEMIEWANRTHPETPWLRQSGRIMAKNEHCADAIGITEAAINSIEFLDLIRLCESMNNKI